MLLDHQRLALLADADGEQVPGQEAGAGEGHEAEQHAPVHGLLEPGVVLGREVASDPHDLAARAETPP